MRLVYCLNCTVCHKNYDGRSSWLKHLCQDEHQNEARGKSVSWWGEDGHGGDERDGVRECTVVIFCSFSLNDPVVVVSLLEKLSRIGDTGGGDEGLNFLVTDFVWWPERDTVAYVQFESRAAVQQIFARFVDSPSLQFDNKLVQLKRAVDILHLEWKALLPKEYSEQTELIPPTNLTTAHPILNENQESSLKSQYISICKSIEIPTQNFNYILEIVYLIKEKLQQNHPSGQVVIFRSYHLRLNTMGTSTLLIYAYIADNPTDPSSYLALAKETQDLIFDCPLLQSRFPNGPFHRLNFPGVLDGGTCYHNPTSGFRLNLVTHPLSIVESQLCLLVQYLCTFDPHVKPLLTLVHFWATSNHVYLAEKNIAVYESQSNSPEPVALEWLVILFLSRERLIPTAREILGRPHKSLMVTDNRIDVGFSEDPKFPKIWRKSKGLPVCPEEHGESGHFILEVVNLARKFFEFYATNLEEGCWVVNPKDGEIMKRAGTHIEKSQLSKEETNLLASYQLKKTTKGYLKIVNFRLFILHPLYISWKLSFDVEAWTESTCHKMKETANKLADFLTGGNISEDSSNLKIILSGGHTGPFIIPPFPSSSYIPNPLSPLQLQFNSICKLIEIPEGEKSYALLISKVIKEIFKKDYPSGRVLLFRNFYLQLKNTGSNTLLIYLYISENPTDPQSYVAVNKEIEQSIFSSSQFQQRCPGFTGQRIYGTRDGGTCYQHDSTNFRFNLVQHPMMIVEAHMCMLVQYLCTFDPHVKPLLTLIYFWAKSHSVRIAEENIPVHQYHRDCPEPVALEWLAILFLTREGVIPSVREIVKRPHSVLLLGRHGHDIGFSREPEFVEEWRRSKGLPVVEEVDGTSDLFVMEVVSLAGKFFEFYGNGLEEGCWVVNPKDGEIIKREGTHIGKSGLSKEEMERLSVVQSGDKIPGYLIISEFRIFVLHPLYITWKLSFDVGRWTEITCGNMKRMGEDLGRWLNGMKKGKQKVSLEEVLAGGAKKSKEVQLELTCESNQNLRAVIRTKLEQRKGQSTKRACKDYEAFKNKIRKKK